MPKLRLLSSADVIKALETFGFEIISQKGSHIKLARYTVLQKQVLTIPNNRSEKALSKQFSIKQAGL